MGGKERLGGDVLSEGTGLRFLKPLEEQVLETCAGGSSSEVPGFCSIPGNLVTFV